MNDTYVIYCNASGEFFESFQKCDVEGDVFTTTDINGAKQFHDLDEANRFCDENLFDAVVLKWM